MKYATATKLAKLTPPFTGEAREIARIAGTHTCLCYHKAGSTGGLVWDKNLIITPYCNRDSLIVQLQDGSSYPADIVGVEGVLGLYMMKGEFLVTHVGHDHTSVGAFLFIYVWGQLFMYQKRKPVAKVNSTMHLPIYGTPVFTRQGEVAGIVTFKPRRNVISFLTDFELPR